MDRDKIEPAISAIVSEMHTKLKEATRIANAAEACVVHKAAMTKARPAARRHRDRRRICIFNLSSFAGPQTHRAERLGGICTLGLHPRKRNGHPLPSQRYGSTGIATISSLTSRLVASEGVVANILSSNKREVNDTEVPLQG